MFSVIIPVYNAASCVRNAIDSILAQTVGDFEIIVVDDGSDDDTEITVSQITDSRIRYIFKENGGVSSARNTGILNAKGEYVCFLDADDLWKPNHLKVVSDLIEKYPSADVFLTGYEILLHDGSVIKKACAAVEGDVCFDNMFKQILQYGYFIHTNSIVCKKSVFDVVGLFEIGVKNGEDDDMWYRLFSYFNVAVSSDTTTTYVRENSRATVSKLFVEDWVFLRRVDDIMASADVSEEKKTYLRCLLEKRKLSFVRYCILNGDKKTAWSSMKRIDKRLLNKKRYYCTLLALITPSVVSSFFVKNRDKKYYGR